MTGTALDQLRQRFNEAAGHARDILRRLDENELPAEFAMPWRAQLDNVTIEDLCQQARSKGLNGAAVQPHAGHAAI